MPFVEENKTYATALSKRATAKNLPRRTSPDTQRLLSTLRAFL